VQLTSRYGQLRVRALVTGQSAGQRTLHAQNSVESPVNRLTEQPHGPSYAHARVQRGFRSSPRAAGSRRKSAAAHKHRFGHPTPQDGVEVERKWKRTDYRIPGNGLVQIQTN